MAVVARIRVRAHASQENGPYSTAVGTTKNTGAPNLPVRRRVRISDQLNGRLQREMWSDATTGQYQFHGLRASVYMVTAYDHTGLYNGEIMTDVVLPTPGG